MSISRQMKFRAWDTDNKCYSSEKLTDFVYQETTKLILNGDFGGMGGRMVFQEWTGRKDRNGVFIYEGDILRIKTEFGKAEIVWVRVNTLMNTKAYRDLECQDKWSNGMDYESYSDDWQDEENITVIGNTFENKEFFDTKN